jgi:hypothetical protein
MDKLRILKMIKYCMIFSDNKKFLVVGQFTENKGALELSEATIVNIDDTLNDLGQEVISKLNSYGDYEEGELSKDTFFLENLKKYGYSSYNDFHKKTEFCLVVKSEIDTVTIVPTKKDRYGFESQPDGAQTCKPDELEISRLVKKMYEESVKSSQQ